MKTVHYSRTIEQIEEAKRLPISECKKILNRSGLAYTDEEVKMIRDFLYQLAAIGLEELNNQDKQAKVISINDTNTNDHEKSHYLRAG